MGEEGATLQSIATTSVARLLLVTFILPHPPPLAPFVTDGVRTGWARYIPRYKQLDTALPKLLDSHT